MSFETSRRIPTRLWIRLIVGPWLVQISSFIVGAGSIAFARLVPHGPDDPPILLVAFILIIGCLPVALVGVGRGRRILYMLRHGDLAGDKLTDPRGEHAELPLARIVGAPAIEGTTVTLGQKPAVAHLFLLPLFAIAGCVVLAMA